MSMKDYLNNALNNFGMEDLLHDTLAHFESKGILLKPIQLSCIIYVAAMEDMDAVQEVFAYLEEIHYRGEDES